jgi:hypothetical protein
LASIRQGHSSDEPVAVDIRVRIDVEYGNRGPDSDTQQQLTNDGFLSSANSKEISAIARQERYRTLSILLGAFNSGPLLEEWQILDEDDYIHSVSDIFALHDEDPEYHKQCTVECWLKTTQRSPPDGTYEPLPNLVPFTSNV